MKQTKAVTASARAPLMKQIYDPRRSELAPAVLHTPLQAHVVRSGMLLLESASDSDMPSMTTIAVQPPLQTLSTGLSSGTSSAATIAATHFAAGSSRSAMSEAVSTEAPPSSQMPPEAILNELMKRRVEAAAHESEPPAKKARRERTCCKCGVKDCPGKGSVKSCRYPCRDCGKAGQDVTCKGRNSKKPNYTCTGQRIPDDQL